MRLLRREPPAPLSSLEAYAAWATSYPPHSHNLLMQLEEAAMLTLMPPINGLHVLDLAGGTGRWSLIAQERGAASVICLDHSLPMLVNSPIARRAAAALDASPLPAGCADAVVCGLAIGHCAQIERPLQEIVRVLKPGGWALISDFHPFAFLNGGRRTFTDASGITRAVEHYVHLIGDVFNAARNAGLMLEGIQEAQMDGSTGPAAMRGAPVAIAYLFRRV